jgi:A/G-specific adenine glycosylase
MIVAEFLLRHDARKLLDWAASDGRQMPWRSSSDPYALAVAEILLQKTRAESVRPVWSRVLATYPDRSSLAAASEEDVGSIVGILGLRRQRSARLIAMARSLDSGSPVPAGIGPYGAAVLALSRHEQPADAPVDGNIARIVCRVAGLSFPRGEPRKKREVKENVRSALGCAGTARMQLRILYALIDLGANVCTPRSPSCAQCPLRSACRYAEACHVS